MHEANSEHWNLHLPARRFDQRQLLLGVPTPDYQDLADQATREWVFGRYSGPATEAGQSNVRIHTAETADEAEELQAAC